MLFISKTGLVDAERVEIKIFSTIERGPMDKVNGIVVHQTGGSTAGSAFSSYSKKNANGAHFLIDKEGKIYQTASLLKKTDHVGWVQSRCLQKKSCAPTEFKRISKLKIHPLHRHEITKKWPDRFPFNNDSIGIELVGGYSGPGGRKYSKK
jgi:N-acetyl-anhydromuramyl-L-alanine amidase AmpD